MSLVWFLAPWTLDGETPDWADAVVPGTTVPLCHALVESLVPRSSVGGAADGAARRADQREALPDDVDPPAVRAALLHVKRLLTLSRRWASPSWSSWRRARPC